jgi:hypothetical protein
MQSAILNLLVGCLFLPCSLYLLTHAERDRKRVLENRKGKRKSRFDDPNSALFPITVWIIRVVMAAWSLMMIYVIFKSVLKLASGQTS